jgi:hypothetical protein
MPAGVLITEPLPVPALEIDLVTLILRVSPALKVAVQVLGAFIVITPLLQPLPLHPVKKDPGPGVAVRLTIVPLL